MAAMTRPGSFLLAMALIVPATPGSAQDVIDSAAGAIRVETFADGLSHPWGLAFLPGGGMLVTERDGNLRFVNDAGEVSEPIVGVPDVVVGGQGGLLDVAPHPDFTDNGLVYWTFSESGEGGANGTAVARGRLSEDRSSLADVEVIFRQQPKVASQLHFGSRLAFDRDGLLWVTLGERYGRQYRVMAQELDNHLGKVIRIRDDGSVPDDNPLVGRQGALPEIWSYGHRNPQGLALNPETGAMWMHEHGPRGGDEVQSPRAGANHGWPVFSFGTEYSGAPITRLKEHPPEFDGPAWQWTPSIAPSGMAFYAGRAFPEWQGDLLAGALVGQLLVRLDFVDGRIAGEERFDIGRRIRDVRVGPDGAVYLLTDESDGEILRLTPVDD
jgi:glucose/arabinose dehydrogenase